MSVRLAVGSGGKGGPYVRESSADAGPLDLDHLGAQVGQHLGGQRRGEDAGEVEDADPGQGGRRHLGLPLFTDGESVI